MTFSSIFVHALIMYLHCIMMVNFRLWKMHRQSAKSIAIQSPLASQKSLVFCLFPLIVSRIWKEFLLSRWKLAIFSCIFHQDSLVERHEKRTGERTQSWQGALDVSLPGVPTSWSKAQQLQPFKETKPEAIPLTVMKLQTWVERLAEPEMVASEAVLECDYH